MLPQHPKARRKATVYEGLDLTQLAAGAGPDQLPLGVLQLQLLFFEVFLSLLLDLLKDILWLELVWIVWL